ncbi:flagellar biosynthesis protein FlgE [Marinobacter guineae]|uniref:Flagellar biosynthesis protein FlgE n=1 Tax=Marinobacter guineae TaxID=432303 RepID=A0A2G1VJB3_9GAMM|nr:flagellar basal body rod C-terminal domain-containing protein [Marinobacter guineae]PHQ26867.1 flagellar biosynthesis protein FlgE [Marinobacter guineae]
MISNTLSNSFSVGIQGIQDGMAGMENAARKIARGGVDGPQGTAEGAGNLIEPMVDLKIYERSVEASAQVVKTADETLGTLLDIMA